MFPPEWFDLVHPIIRSPLAMLKLIVGCGYLGERVARLWREAGHPVAVVTRSPDKLLRLTRDEGFQGVLADVLDPDALRDLPACDTLLFAVGYDRRSSTAPIETVYPDGLRNVLDALAASPRASRELRRVVYISSTGVYGQVEGAEVDEDSPCRPHREGGRASLAAENVLRSHPLGDRGVILRLAGIYGPGRIPRRKELLAGEPIAAPSEGSLNLIHVDDAARIVVAAAADTKLHPPALLCVSDGSPVVRGEYYAELARLLGAPPPTFTEPEASSPAAQRAGSDKRVSNARLRAALPLPLLYPSYREGLRGIVAEEDSAAESGRSPIALAGNAQQPAEQLAERIASGTALVGVIGLGYVGLPLARAFLEAGFRVLGFDIDPHKVEQLQAGRSYIGHLSSDDVQQWRRSGRFEATADPTRLAEPDALLICVPTPLDERREPDLSYVVNTARQIGAVLRRGQLVVLESTTYPGTTENIVRPLLDESGLASGSDYFLAYSPEREDPGNPRFTARTIPKVVGGLDDASASLAESLYAPAVVQTVRVSHARVAEACKILENTYRAVNIALVNELKIIFDRMGIDIWEVIEAAKTKPFGFQPFYPGPGLGGHCIPIDPFYLSWIARQHGLPARFIELAGEINTAMPEWVIERLSAALGSQGKELAGSRIAVLGVAYKRDVDDPRESPAFRLMELLTERGAEYSYHDPYIPRLPSMRHYRTPDLASEPLTPQWLAAHDAALIVTDHACIDWDFVVEHSRLVVDTRHATRNVVRDREKIHPA